MTDAELIAEIDRLRKESNAVILAHNYQPMPIQDLADFTGDSLGLSRLAAETDAEVIVFCGVRFMAETAKILSPGKTVTVPEPVGGCPMAAMAAPADVERMRREHPGAQVVCYVNSTAGVKAVSDACCTSANALEVVDGMDSDEIIFLPDRNLGSWVARHTARRVILWDGYCHVHVKIAAADVRDAKEKHPGAVVIVHPECEPDVIDLADEVLSTSGMLRFAAGSEARTFIVGTEATFLERLSADNPGKDFVFPGEPRYCPDMKLSSLEGIFECLRGGGARIELPSDVASGARRAIDRMMRATGSGGTRGTG